MSNPILYIMIGIPGSGKSTYVKEVKKENEVYVSRDEIRFSLLSPNDTYFAKEKEVEKLFYSKIAAALKENKNVYADATHLNKKSRFKTIANVNKYLNKYYRDVYDIAYIYMDTPLDIALERNAQRNGRSLVPKDKIISMYNGLEFPTADEPYLILQEVKF